MSDLSLQSKIEAVLFYKSEPVAKNKLAQLTEVGVEELEAGLNELESSLQGRGLQLVMNGDEVMLGTSAEASTLIENLQKDDISRDLGKAGSETLAIVLYKGPISRREIDYIRGVNSAFVVRNLLVRGLIERMEGEGKARGYLYRATTELLSFMGLSTIQSLPEFENVRTEMNKFAAVEQQTLEENDAT